MSVVHIHGQVDAGLLGPASEGVERARRLFRRLRAPIAPVPTEDSDPETGGRGGSETQQRLAAIRAYADFLVRHPDMPSDHRRRFLASIARCCEEASGQPL